MNHFCIIFRRNLLIFLILGGWLPCAEAQIERESRERLRMESVIRRVVEVWNEANWELARDLLHPEVHLVSAGSELLVSQVTPVVANLAQRRSGWPHHRLSVEVGALRLLEESSGFALVEWTLQPPTRGPGSEAAPWSGLSTLVLQKGERDRWRVLLWHGPPPAHLPAE